MATAAETFYDVHQRSQLTGVPTSEYNAARDAFLAEQGLSTGDSFSAINQLASLGYQTGVPTDEYIVEYGSVISDTGIGNLSYSPGSSQGYYEEAVARLEGTSMPKQADSFGTPSVSSTLPTSLDDFNLASFKGVMSGTQSETSLEESGRGDIGQDYTGSRYKIRKKKSDEKKPVLASKGLKVGDLYAGLNIGKGSKGKGTTND